MSCDPDVYGAGRIILGTGGWCKAIGIRAGVPDPQGERAFYIEGKIVAHGSEIIISSECICVFGHPKFETSVRRTMANRYGEAALLAAEPAFSADKNPAARWQSAVERLYPTSLSARRKGCHVVLFWDFAKKAWLKASHRVSTRSRRTIKLMQ